MVKKLFILLPLVAILSCGKGSLALKDVAAALEKATPGDTLVIRDGRYEDVTLKWKGHATKESPVVVRPETPGGVVLKGKSQLKIYGEGLTVSGIRLENCVAEKGTIVEFRNTHIYNWGKASEAVSNYLIQETVKING